MRIFGAERIQGLMERLGMEEGEPIEHRMVTRAIENAQKKVEGHNFDIRKHLLEYDDVMNKQREVIYDRRRETLGGENLQGGGPRNDRGSFRSWSSRAAIDEDVASATGIGMRSATGVAERFGLRFDLPEERRDG